MKMQHNHLHLIGNPEENFFILGKKDKDSYHELTKQISMLCTRNESLAKVLKIANQLSTRGKHHYNPRHIKELSAYAEGLETSLNDVMFAFLLPEVVAAFNKWVPNLMSIIPGCSSLFVLDPKTNKPIHTRVLDYALSGPFEKNERTILYDFKDRYKTFSLSSTGVPLASMTAINEKGLTLALHYKHGRYFDQSGESIFTITDEIIGQCSNIREAIKLVKKKKSISYWGIYLSDSNGEVASIDIRGGEVYQEKFDLRDHDHLYFNNRPLLAQEDHLEIQPYGNLEQCKSRMEIVQKNLKQFDITTSKDPYLDLIKVLYKKNKTGKSSHAKNFKLSPVHSSSIQVCSMGIGDHNFYYVTGQAPKNTKQTTLGFENIFLEPKIKIKTKEKKLTAIEAAQQYISKYQSFLDLSETSKAYHNIQMALKLQEGHEDWYISQFYFLITQYIYENDQRDYTYILQDLEKLDQKLPIYLEDHRKLFIQRLSRILGHSHGIKSSLIKNEQLKKRFIEESQLNPMALKGLKFLIFPRIEILDIIYSY